MLAADVHDEQVGIAVRRMVGDDLVIGDANPLLSEPKRTKRLEDMNCQRGRRGIWFSPRRLDHSMTSCACPGKDACGYRVAVDSQTKVCWGCPAKHRHRQARLLARENTASNNAAR